MIRKPVRSSNLSSVGYENGTLEVQFHSGGIYRYSGVPENVYRNLMSAASLGSYFAAFIKDRYPTKQIC